MSVPLLSAAGLVKHLGSGKHRRRVVDDVGLTLAAGETVALVGGSGAGKTTLVRLLVRLAEPDAGSLQLAGDDLLAVGGAALRRRRAEFQVVFQDPLAALNPRATVGRLLDDPLRIHRPAPKAERRDRVAELLRRVGLEPGLASRLPHELSGGQRQRVNIARALAPGPRLLVLDEPVTALDVSVRAQILNLLLDVQRTDGLAYLIVTHDLAVVRAVADRVLVMDRGRIVEAGATADVLNRPEHAATRALVAAAPRLQHALERPMGAVDE